MKKSCVCKGVLCIILLFSILFGNLPIAVNAEGSEVQQLEMVGQFGGECQALAVDKNYVFAGTGSKMNVLKISDKGTLEYIGSSKPLPSMVRDIAIQGNTAFLACGDYGISIMDLTDMSSPRETAHVDTSGFSEALVVMGSTLYLADGPCGLAAFDIRKSDKPVKIGQAYKEKYLFDVAISGNYAYLAAGGAGLLSANVENPQSIVESGSYDTPGNAFGVDVVNGKAYVADGWGGIQVVDVSAAGKMTLLAAIKTQGWVYGTAVSKDTVLAADAFMGLRAFNAKNVKSVVEAGSYDLYSNHCVKVIVTGSRAVVADKNHGILLLDISNPKNINLLSSFGSMNFSMDVCVSGNYAYIAADQAGLKIVDISIPEDPVLAGEYFAYGNVQRVVVEGKYAYIIAGFGAEGHGLHIVDISNPAKPLKTGYLSNGMDMETSGRGVYRDLVLKDGVAYIANEIGLLSVDVRNPRNPVVLDSYKLQESYEGCTLKISASGNRVYLVNEGHGISVFDISNPKKPVLVSAPKMSRSYGVASLGSNLLMDYQTVDGTLSTFDATNEKELKLKKSFDLGGTINVPTINGNLASVACTEDGVALLDLSNPDDVKLAAAGDTPGLAYRTWIKGDYLFVADGGAGLTILSIKKSASTPKRNGAGRAMPDRKAFLGSLKETHSPEEKSPYVAKANKPGKTWVVKSDQDSGRDTLRDCMEKVQSGDTILFDPKAFPLGETRQINLRKALPALTKGYITIDGSNANVALNGYFLKSGENGLTIVSSGNTIKGLRICNFPGNGIEIKGGAKGNTIGGNLKKGRGPMGEGVQCEHDLYGIVIRGQGTDHNTVKGCYIGIQMDGKNRGGMLKTNVLISEGAKYNTIGSRNPDERVVLGGSDEPTTLLLKGKGTERNKVIGCYAGVDITGLRETLLHGSVQMENGASFNQIGGLLPGEGNVLCYTGREAVSISGYNVVGNIVEGNYLGVVASGKSVLKNYMGIWINMGAPGTVVRQNVISGNQLGGVVINDITCFTTMVGNRIGTDSTGLQKASNNLYGIWILQGSSYNRIGGTDGKDRNIISGNDHYNIYIDGALGGSNNFVLGNYIGTDISGTKKLDTQAYDRETRINRGGIKLCEDARYNFIGGFTQQEKNLISGNPGYGIGFQYGSGLKNNFILGNAIGTDADSKLDLGNGLSGITLGNTGANFIIRNTISNNHENGIHVNTLIDSYMESNLFSNNEKEDVSYWPPRN